MLNIVDCTVSDAAELARLNRMLIEDEKAENDMTAAQLERRMEGFLTSDYKAFYFYSDKKCVGYALVNAAKTPVYLRQFFICREDRRKGYGREAFYALLKYLRVEEIDVDVYAWNRGGVEFWREIGFCERVYGMRYKL
jgi:Sortase and related acyltransferases